MSMLAASRTTRLLHAGATNPLAARVSGYHVAFLAAAVMSAIGATLPALLLGRQHTRHAEGQLDTDANPTPVTPSQV